jgi:hypothetical protein
MCESSEVRDTKVGSSGMCVTVYRTWQAVKWETNDTINVSSSFRFNVSNRFNVNFNFLTLTRNNFPKITFECFRACLRGGGASVITPSNPAVIFALPARDHGLQVAAGFPPECRARRHRQTLVSRADLSVSPYHSGARGMLHACLAAGSSRPPVSGLPVVCLRSHACRMPQRADCAGCARARGLRRRPARSDAVALRELTSCPSRPWPSSDRGASSSGS